MTYQPICCSRERHGCGKLFTPERKFQKACSNDCASSMLGFMAQEHRKARRQAHLDRVTSPSITPSKKRRRRRKKTS